MNRSSPVDGPGAPLPAETGNDVRVGSTESGPSAPPHLEQNRLPSGTRSAQAGHEITATESHGAGRNGRMAGKDYRDKLRALSQTTQDGSAAPARVLGPVDAMCVVIGAIVGVGIFFTPSTTAGLTRSGFLMLLAWAIGGAIALCGALTF